MRLEQEYTWIKDEDFNDSNPLTGKVLDVTTNTNQWGKAEHVLQFQLDKGGYRQMSLWGNNLNTLVKKFGNESDNWKERTVKILFTTDPGTGKKVRSIDGI